MRTFYICDADKNIKCKKTSCVHNPNTMHNVCDKTSNVDYAKRDEEGRPVIAPPIQVRMTKTEVPIHSGFRISQTEKKELCNARLEIRRLRRENTTLFGNLIVITVVLITVCVFAAIAVLR